MSMRSAVVSGLAWLALSLPAFAACEHDREALLALPFEAFDQSLEGGWRPLADMPGCETAAADLIAAYRTAHIERLSEQEARGLRWHEAQLRAAAGQTDEAIALFTTTRHADSNVRARAQNAYVDATIAFLRNDRSALEQARAQLAGLPKPEGFDEAVAQARARYGDAFADRISWPSNLDVVDGFLACFGKLYAEAYKFTCRRARQ